MPFFPNISLLCPDPTVTPGPTYASENNTAFERIDNHDHSGSGKGLPIPAAALNINSNVSFNSFNATSLRSTRYTPQSSNLSLPSDINCIYSFNGNLVWNNQLGQPVQITQGATLDATSIGGIGGDFGTSTASVFYTSATKTFTFWSNTNTPAHLDAGNVTIRNATLNSFGITLAPDPSIASNYQLTLPASLPSTTSALEVSPSGVVTYSGGINPSGTIVMWGGVAAPSGWLLCDGTSYLRTAQPGIFAAIGTAYGAADGTHFNVPDFRGMFPRGVDAGAGNDPDTLTRTAANPGGNTGDNVGSFQVDGQSNHTHSYTVNTAGGATEPATNIGSSPGNFSTNGVNSISGVTAITTENRPKNLYVNFIIKV